MGFDPERWRELSPLLDEVLDLEPAARAGWLAALRTRAPEFAADVEALVAEHAALEEQGFLAGSALTDEGPPTLAGMVVGAYRLRAPLGQGGMGSVWLADRCDGRFEGVAAVKLLNVSLIGRDGEARFQREGSLLARVRHPHIAQLIDAGVSSLGQPYLVLEHVDGERIDHHCDAARLGVESRVRLFLDVLAAIAFAHANLIVHRDIKPQNVLVDRSGQVKLLDFGIAKLIEPEAGAGLASAAGAAPASALTREGEVALTPQYAAPEQLTGGAITTATDVYALGILLYLLLTGRHPSGPTDSSPAEWIRAVVERTPTRPSLAVSGDPDASARFDAAPRRIARALAGDLDTIVAKALAKRPEDRYASVESFADDLRRHLNHEPIGARAEPVSRRALKFVRRHRAGVAAASVVVAAIVAGAGGVAWQAREASRQRDAARTQLGRATAANEFTTYLLSVAAPGGGKFTVGELLQQGEALIDKQFRDDAMRAEMLTTIGQQYYLADQFDKATAVLERAFAAAERTHDPAIRARAACPLALMKVNNDDRPGAEALITRALNELPDAPQFALQRADCLIQHSAFGVVTGEPGPMIERARRALAILDAHPGATQVKRLEAQLNLAYGLFLAHRVREADAVYEDLTKGLDAAGRGRTIAAADAFHEWGIAHFHDNLVREEPLVRHALELRKRIDADGNVAASYTLNLACALRRLERFEEAEALFREAITTATRQGVRGLQYAAMLELSALYVARGDLRGAAAELDTVEPHAGEPSFSGLQKARLATQRGLLLAAQGKPTEARASFLRASAAFDAETEKVTGHVDALLGLSRAEETLGDRAAARAATERALTVARDFVEPDTPSYLVGLALVRRGELELAGGDRDAARADFRSAAEHLRQTLGAEHRATRDALDKSVR